MNSNKKFFSKIGFNYLIYIISSLIITIIIANIIAATKPEIINNINISTVISAICNYILPLPILIHLMNKIKSTRPEIHKINIKTFLKYLCITITLMWIGNLTGTIITTILGGAIQSDISNPIQNLINSTDIWLNLLLISIIGPIFEEFFFRKLLIDRTIVYGAKVSIILSAVIFGLVHGNLNQFFYSALIGGFLGYVYIKTGRITYTIALHMIINLIGSVVSLSLNNSISSLSTGTINPIALIFVISYFTMLIISLFIGISSIWDYKKAKFNGEKTEINLKNPLKTVFLNTGMICFVLFFIIKMILQAIS
ncbi:CPBP family intramembrane glutamic endopeptidase [uncultured Methanobrevibacter sp.]|uniref:CPBP family intramembrane glutamic endopeptidase n=1 Tax=uncultured Methanobrevibacter sp. TaxID=253161 RepID=UPI0025F79462|nr:CPBP family intramembrane glutamic endopeptidase [uncultured Methanobrevibacter sp.]MCI6995118.1 CPBP family intramembrane metalloprotease [Methanobrevibacter sp.]